MLMLARGAFASGPEAASAADIEQGAVLAAVANCAGCHSKERAAPFAGGVPLHTPFGTIYGSNISPDPKDGIGAWSRADFVRAMREGVAKDGSHLYPAFPYDHFTHASDEELDQLYAYIMSRAPVAARPPPNQLDFPFDQRGLLAFWDSLYLDPGAQPAHDGELARGEHLALSLGHCDSCHSPRNALGAEVVSERFDGGHVDGWTAPALNRHSPSPLHWTQEQLTQYLRTGIADQHAMAGGPMRDVVQSLAHADPADVAAIAAYIVALMGPRSPDAERREAQSIQRSHVARSENLRAGDAEQQLGATVYQGACASCHDQGRGASSNQALQMPLAIAAYDPDPKSLLRVIREGIDPIEGGAQRLMPAFYGSLTNQELTALAAYIRLQAADLPLWPNLAQQVEESAE
jgi:mono/diheme cytochrome c family protein